jgi:hypothetical protein
VTKRFLIWLFWFAVAGAVWVSVDNNDGVIQLPTWFGVSAVAILFGWWARFLAVKYPKWAKISYGAAGAAVLFAVLSVLVQS